MVDDATSTTTTTTTNKHYLQQRRSKVVDQQQPVDPGEFDLWNSYSAAYRAVAAVAAMVIQVDGSHHLQLCIMLPTTLIMIVVISTDEGESHYMQRGTPQEDHSTQPAVVVPPVCMHVRSMNNEWLSI